MLAIFSLSSFGLYGVTASAAEKEEVQLLTSEQLKEMNAVLEKLRNQVNDKLEKGETDIIVYGDLSFQEEPLSLEFHTEEPNTSLFATQQRKPYDVTVKNTAGFNFSHNLSGSFLWGAGKVGSYSYEALLKGPLYGKTETTKATELDPSVVEVSSVGKFRALKYAPVEYTTNIKVELYGSGTYRVMRATIG